jgi:hypothetical protein
MLKRFASDESGITVSVETIILFSISIILMLMILQTFQGLNQKQTKIVLEEQFISIGNSIAKKITEMNLVANSGLATGSITSEIWIPAKIVDRTYSVQLSKNKVILESNDPYVTVEVPLSSDIKIAQNGTIISTDYKYTLKYDSETCSISFLNSGAVLIPDTSDPSISIYSPTEGATIKDTTKIIVNVSDDVSVKKVEYYMSGNLEYTAINPYTWDWDTRTTPNGLHNVTAVAYDCMGNKKPDTKNYTVSNTNFSPPVISNPSPNSTIHFRKPIIQATISDDIKIDFSSILLKVDGIDRTANITYANVSQKLTTISYTPSNNMDNGSHYINLSVKDFDSPDPGKKNWSFIIEDLSDDYNPTVTIEYPTNITTLNPGEFIEVSYTASDMDNSSGLDNLTINVTRIDDGVSNLYYKNISIYPTIRKTINPMETWTSSEKYVAGMSYNYYITIFDRSGNMSFASLLNLTVRPGQADQLNVDTSSIDLPIGNKIIEDIRVRDISTSAPVVEINYIIVSWSNPSGRNINRVRFNGNTKWSSSGSYSPSGTQPSGTQLTLNPSYIVPTSNKKMELRFTADISDRYFTIVFLLSDGSTKTVTFDTY